MFGGIVAVLIVAALGAIFWMPRHGGPAEVREAGFFSSITEEDSLGYEDFLVEIEEDEQAKELFESAKENGYKYVKATEKIVDDSGVTTTLTPMVNEDGDVVVLSRIYALDAYKSELIHVNVEEGTLTTYNDDFSEITTDLVSGEVVVSRGPLTHHSDEYDFNVNQAIANAWLWYIGLNSWQNSYLFGLMCGVFDPDELIETIVDIVDDPFDVFEDQVTCVEYLVFVDDIIDDLVESGDIVSFLPDLQFGKPYGMSGESVYYTGGNPGAFFAYIVNRGDGYSGNFLVNFYGQYSNGDLRRLKTAQVESIRPSDSNSEFPHEEWQRVMYEYLPGEGEKITVKIDPFDVIEEVEENNNQYVFDRSKLNHKPVADILSVNPNPVEVGQTAYFTGNAVDVDGHIALRGYQWDFGDGTIWRTGRTIYYTFNTSGPHTVKLRAVDSEGLWSDWVSMTVQVNPEINRPVATNEKLMIHSAFFTPDGKGEAIAFKDHSLMVLSGSTLYEVSAETGEEISSMEINSVPSGGEKFMEWDGTYIWIADKNTKKIFRLNVRGELVESFELQQPPSGFALAGSKVYVTTGQKSIAKYSPRGSLESVFETSEEFYDLVYAGGNFWATNSSKLLKLDDSFNVLERYPISNDDCVFNDFIDYPYKPVDLSWDGQYLWVLGRRGVSKCWEDEQYRKATIYKVDASGYTTPYISSIAGLSMMKGMVWDIDGWIVSGSNAVTKFTTDGKFIGKISKSDVYDGDGTNFVDAFTDQKNVWVYAGVARELSPTAETLRTVDPGLSSIVSSTYYRDYWWFASTDKIYKVDANGQVLETYVSPVPNIVDMIWAGRSLWISNDTVRIFKVAIESGAMKVTDIYTPYASEPAKGMALGFDGQYLWYSGQGKLYKLEHIPVRPERLDRAALWTKESMRVTHEVVSGASSDAGVEMGNVCYNVNVERDYNLDLQIIRHVYVAGDDEIYVTREDDGFQMFDGSSVVDLDDIVPLNGYTISFNWSNDLEMAPQTGNMLAALDDGLYEYNWYSWGEYYPSLEASWFKPVDFSISPGGMLFANGYAMINGVKTAILAKYTNKDWEVVANYDDMDELFSEISMLSGSSGFLANRNGLFLLKGGEWVKQDCKVPNYVNDIKFSSVTNGYIAGNNGMFSHFDGKSCTQLVGLPSSFNVTEILPLMSTKYIVAGSSTLGENAIYYFDGEVFRRIRLTDIVSGGEGKTYNWINDLGALSDGVVMVGSEANFLVCPSLQQLIDSTKSEVKISDGNVVRMEKTGGITVIVNKADYEGIEEFYDLKVSPDGSRMCFLGQSMVPQWTFVADITGKNVKKLGLGSNCVWSHDSQKVLYNNFVSDVSPVNVLGYDFYWDEELNLTKWQNMNPTARMYSFGEPRFSEDDETVYADYVFMDFSKSGELRKGTVEIDYDKKTVTGE